MPTKSDGSTVQVMAVIPTELLKRLDALGVELERSRSWMIYKAIQMWCEAEIDR